MPPLLLQPQPCVPSSSTACRLAREACHACAAAHAHVPGCRRTCRHSESFCVRRLSTVGTATAGFWRSSATTCNRVERSSSRWVGVGRGVGQQNVPRSMPVATPAALQPTKALPAASAAQHSAQHNLALPRPLQPPASAAAHLRALLAVDALHCAEVERAQRLLRQLPPRLLLLAHRLQLRRQRLRCRCGGARAGGQSPAQAAVQGACAPAGRAVRVSSRSVRS